MAMNPRTSDCPDLQDLAAWVDGNVDDAKRAHLVAHLAACSDCFEIVSSALEWKAESDAAPSPSEKAPSEGGVIPFSARRRFPWAAALPLAATLAVAVVGWGVYAKQLKEADAAAVAAFVAADASSESAAKGAVLRSYPPPSVAPSSLLELLKFQNESTTRGESSSPGLSSCEESDCAAPAELAAEKYRRWSRFSRTAQKRYLAALVLVPERISVGYLDDPNWKEVNRLARSSDPAVRISAWHVLDILDSASEADLRREVAAVDSARLGDPSAAYFLGLLAQDNGNAPAAVKAFKRFLELAPPAPSAWRTFAEKAIHQLESSSPPQ